MLRRPFSIVLLSLLVLSMALNLSPIYRKFDINDRSISKPYIADEFVAYRTVVLVAGILPALLFMLVLRLNPLPRKNKVTLYVVFGACILSTSAIVESTKRIFGRLRPDFLDRCMPVDGACTGRRMFVEKGRVSFPSGHSAVSFCGFLFLIFFIHSKLRLRIDSAEIRHLVRGMLYVGLLSAPLVIAASRVFDNRHFVSDVVAGGVLGIAVAATGFRYALDRVFIQEEREGILDKAS
jgi:diacylglycerol diphosphate phosphatase / phosphatidate phosphatase